MVPHSIGSTFYACSNFSTDLRCWLEIKKIYVAHSVDEIDYPIYFGICTFKIRGVRTKQSIILIFFYMVLFSSLIRTILDVVPVQYVCKQVLRQLLLNYYILLVLLDCCLFSVSRDLFSGNNCSATHRLSRNGIYNFDLSCIGSSCYFMSSFAACT